MPAGCLTISTVYSSILAADKMNSKNDVIRNNIFVEFEVEHYGEQVLPDV
jgi:hypothetical protein